MATRWQHTPTEVPEGTAGERRSPSLAEECPTPTLHSPPTILTEEGATIEADGGLAGDLCSVKDGII
jgi:hypothetical protein